MRNVCLLFTALLLLLCIQRTYAQNTSPYWSLAGNSNATTGSKLGTTNAIPLRIQTNNTERMYIGTNGFVGIGTTSPQARLHIVDNVNLSGYFKPLRVYNPSLATGQHVQLAFGKSNSTYNQGEINFNLVGGAGSANNTLSFGLYGQPTIITLQGTGNVGIGTSTPSAKLHVEGGSIYALYANTTGYYGVYAQGNSYGMYGSSSDGIGVNGLGLYGVQGTSNNAAYGVYGSSSATYSDNGSAGVFGTGYYGVYGSSDAGEGVHGDGGNVGISGQGSTYGLYGEGGTYGIYASNYNSGGWAGYFSGNVYSTGTYQGSDRKLKKNIEDFTSATDIIGKLQPKSYEYRQDGDYKLMNLPEGKHYGLIAQDVEQVLPNLVKATKFDVGMAKQSQTKREPGKAPTATATQAQSIDFKGVNYTELIPIMVKGMQEQDKRLQEQEAENKALKAEVADLRQMLLDMKNGTTMVTGMGVLNQATPNPANGTTRISYTLPNGSTQAQLLVTDAVGKTIKAIQLNGSGSIDVNTTSLGSGVYNYSLYVEGKQVDAKRLVIAR